MDIGQEYVTSKTTVRDPSGAEQFRVSHSINKLCDRGAFENHPMVELRVRVQIAVTSHMKDQR